MCPWTLVSQGKISRYFPFFLVLSDSPAEAEQVPMHLWQEKQDPCSQNRMQGSVQDVLCKCSQFCYQLGEINTLLTDYYFNLQVFITWIPEAWNFCVRRQCLLQDIWKKLKSASNQDFRKILKVRYEIVFLVSSKYFAAVFLDIQCYWILVEGFQYPLSIQQKNCSSNYYKTCSIGSVE